MKTQCPQCKNNLKLITVDEYDISTYWCEECGTLTLGRTTDDTDVLIPNRIKSDVEEPPENIPFCCKCSNKMTQPNLFDKSQELVGCSLLTKTQWDNGMNNGIQTKCPLISNNA